MLCIAFLGKNELALSNSKHTKNILLLKIHFHQMGHEQQIISPPVILLVYIENKIMHNDSNNFKRISTIPLCSK